jgi:Undecaprenyl-phosphate glucose phosphotransferase
VRKTMSVQLSGQPPSVANSVGLSRSESTAAKRLSIVLGLLLTFEFLIVATSTCVAAVFYHYITFKMMLPLGHYVEAALFIATMFTIVSLGFRHFAMAKRQQLHMFLWSGVGAVALSFVLFLTAIFLLKISQEFSRGAFIFEVATVCTVVCISRAVTLFWLRAAVTSGAIESRHAIVIGDTSQHSGVIDELRSGGIRVVRSIPLPRPHNVDSDCDRKSASNLNVRNTINLCRTTLPDDIVILAAQNDLSVASDLAHSLSELPCSIHIAPVDNVRFLARSHITDLGSVMALQVSMPPLTMAELAVKRIFDIVIATIALIVLSPLMLTVALAIKLDSSGNVFYRQKRHGYNNRVIRVFKFRSMTVAEDNTHNFEHATPDDVRVTGVGRILRRTNIDELPQLFNVLLGEMSIVGPRPHATVHNKMFEEQILPFARRHNMKPGITGWAQVNGYRGAADTIDKMRRRVEYDLYYIDNWSFFLDLKIIMMTLFSRKAYINAY